MNAGERLKMRREQAHMTQTRLAELTGMNMTYISKIETGERGMSAESAMTLAFPLGVTPLWLLHGGHDAVCPYCLQGA